MTITSHTVVESMAELSSPQTNAGGSQVFASRGSSRTLMLGAAFGLLLGIAGTALGQAAPPPPAPKPVARPVLVGPSSSARFQQTVRQQQATDSLQKAQVEAQNRQGVSSMSQTPNANNPQLQNQTNQSDAAQQNIERARQQDIINRYQATPVPQGRVVVPPNPPPKPANGG